MVHPTARPEQTPLNLTWTIELDVAALNALHHVDDLRRLRVGSQVIVHVGTTQPGDDNFDPRLLPMLAENAQSYDLRLDIRGTLPSVAAWWHALRETTTPPGPHLQLVRDSERGA